MILTCGIGELILLALYSVFERLGFSSGRLDARLHRFWRDIGGHVGEKST